MAQRDPKNTEGWELLLLYRRVFGSDEGQQVLQDILEDLKYFDTVESVNDATLHNAAKMLLFKCGMIQDFQVGAFIKSLFQLPYSPPETDKGKENKR
jgi:hypothetical protein